ncbi:MAG: alpha-2-macroglobulin family protein [Armatimonadota bacterium]
MKHLKLAVVLLGFVFALLLCAHLGLFAQMTYTAPLIVRSNTPGAQKPPAPKTPRDRAQQMMNQGNWKDAYQAFAKLALDPKDDPRMVGGDLANAIQCLSYLNREEEIDAFREKVIAANAGNWRLLDAAARSYLNNQHYGFLIAGKFSRGYHRGGGRGVNAYERDRVRALQLEVQAMRLSHDRKDLAEVGNLYWNAASMLSREYWRLQYLTDLGKLPDYDEGYYDGGSSVGTPVDEAGSPVYYALPTSWQAARNDGERWRWALRQTMVLNPSRRPEVLYTLAGIMQSQFGEQTLQDYRWFFSKQDDQKENESGIFALHTLRDDETIARLATGVKRFTLPREFNYLKIYLEIANGKEWYATESLRRLAAIYENRRQYDRAAEYWQRAYELTKDQSDLHHRNEILGNFGRFEPVTTQPAGKGATVEFRFRNAKKVSFTAQQIDVQKLLADVQAYLKSNPRNLSWEKMDIANIGYRLVQQRQKQYVGKQVAAWELSLTPRPHHFDSRITVATPLQKAGAYLLTAKMANGNTSQIILWVADTAIVKKTMEKGAYYYVADAANGKPIPGAHLSFFGYHHQWYEGKNGKGSRYEVVTRSFTGNADKDGQFIATSEQQHRYYNWIVTATGNGRLAYLGFVNAWYDSYRYDVEYNEPKRFMITDRPVYRPGQPVKFKFWVNQVKYDKEGKSPYAGRHFSVDVYNPKRQKVFETRLTADDYGGFDGEFILDKEAALGVYGVRLDDAGNTGYFRVEEYKKPEYEVTVDAPKEPVMLGEKITATIQAKYYFGAPVTNAKVKYKILRSNYSANWYPSAYWDWYYGAGYWWYAPDYAWYPGWGNWGCRRPIPFWWGSSYEQPELIAEAETTIGKDGVLKVPIDTTAAKAMHGDTDHRYQITAEVTDQSRRTIVGEGTVLVARKPFKVYAWVDRGHYRAGDVVQAEFTAQTLDNKPVQGDGTLRLLKISYVKDKSGQLQPVETEVEQWDLPTDAQGRAHLQIKAADAGQYRLSYTVTDDEKHTIQGGYLFCVYGAEYTGGYRFNDIELISDKREYQPGDNVNLMINTNQANSTVLLFARASNGVYLRPEILRLNGKSVRETVSVLKKDMPNFFIEAVTVSGGKVYSETREIVVPPEKRVLNVDVTPSAEKYKPGEKATMTVKVTDKDGNPYRGSTVVSLYDKSVEYISGGSNVPEIKQFFWKWRRSHQPRMESSLDKGSGNLTPPGGAEMENLGAFGYMVVPDRMEVSALSENLQSANVRLYSSTSHMAVKSAAAMPEGSYAVALAPQLAAGAPGRPMVNGLSGGYDPTGGPTGGQPLVQPTVRSNFADTALWVGALTTDEHGEAKVELTMPENLTTWKARVWSMGDGARVGEGSAEVVTTKDLLVRLQAPRFFTEKDEVVISANVHNYLKTAKKVQVVLEIEERQGAYVSPLFAKIQRHRPDGWDFTRDIEVAQSADQRVDWRVRIDRPGEVVVRVKALTDEESDAMEMTFPAYVHGMLKTESFSGVVRPEQQRGAVKFRVPAERRPEQSRLEVRYSPTLAGAMVDALPYMIEYPYGCTEQTLNRFLPAVITQNALKRMGLNLKEIRDKRTNLNAQEIGDDTTRAEDWKRMGKPIGYERNPVFDDAEMNHLVNVGVNKLTSMQNGDGGWGWFSGYGEQSYPHTTALVVHGLQIAKVDGAPVEQNVLARGVEWLRRYQGKQVAQLQLWDKTKKTKNPQGKPQADALDAFVYLVLVDAGKDNKAMRDYLYRDRNNLPVYAKSMFGIALHKVKDIAKRDMLIRNIEQYLVQDNENQTAYLRLPANDWWWCWYGSEYEAQAYYLKLLTVTDPKGEKASRLVKYLINNRKHATYWNSTRDTAVVIEAFADYLKASGEEKPNMTVTLLLDGKPMKEVKIDGANLFSFDNKLVLEGADVTTGEHTVELVKTGSGSLYLNAYLTNFTLEDSIKKAGLEIKVNRAFYKLVPVVKSIKVEGAHGQALDQRVEKYERQLLKDLSRVKSGDLLEVELTIDSKNDYEYILFEDMKAAGCEPMDIRSGYNANDMGAYMELRDERVCFFVRALARGKHSVSYRLRAEIPGQFSALPTKASAMYAPELKANSDEMKLRIEDGAE